MGAGGSPCGVAGRAALPWDPPLPPRRGYRLRPIWVGQRGDGSKAEGFSPHRTDNQGGFPPYLRAAIVPGQGGRLCRGTRPCPGSMAAVII